jgi:hypothetical protein
MLGSNQAHCGDYMFESYASGKPQSVRASEGQLASVAASSVIESINRILQGGETDSAAYEKYFGVEQLGIFGSPLENGDSSYLAYLFESFSERGELSSKLEISLKNANDCWKISETGDYTTFAAPLNIEGSKFKSGILFFRVERLPSQGGGCLTVASARPGTIYLSIR